MKKIFLSILLMSIVTSMFAAPKPDWVKIEPIEPEYFSSVIKVNKNRVNYKEIASQMALNNISRQISVQVSSEYSLHETANMYMETSDFQSLITTNSSVYLENVELVGTYETGKEYWVFYRLNKQKYKADREEKKTQTVSRAVQLLKQFDESNSDLANGIISLFSALEAIESFVDMDMSAVYRNQNINLYNEIILRIKNLPNTLEISFEGSAPQFVAMKEKIIPLSCKAVKKDKENISPLKHFPIEISMQRGKAKIINIGFTDNDGVCDFSIEKITSFEPEQIILAQVNKKYFSNNFESAYVKKMFDSLEFKKSAMNIDVIKPKLFIHYKIDGNNRDAVNTLLIDKCLAWNINVVNSENEAHYKLEIDASSRPGNFIEMFNHYAAFVDFEVKLTDLENGKVLYNKPFNNSKGSSPDANTVIEKAELSAINSFCNEVLSYMLREHILSAY